MIKFLPPPEIEAAAEEFLRKYHPDRTVPIPIEEILDLQLRLNIIPVPGLFNHSIDAFLSVDLKNLYIDQEHLEHRINRARFTLAHEAGHLSLHAPYILSQKIDSVESWKKIVLGQGSARFPLIKGRGGQGEFQKTAGGVGWRRHLSLVRFQRQVRPDSFKQSRPANATEGRETTTQDTSHP